eukprot:894056_1
MATPNHHPAEPEDDVETGNTGDKDNNVEKDNTADMAMVTADLLEEVIPAAIELQVEVYSAVAGEAKDIINRAIDGASDRATDSNTDINTASAAVNPDASGMTEANASVENIADKAANDASDAINSGTDGVAKAVGSAGGDTAADTTVNAVSDAINPG